VGEDIKPYLDSVDADFARKVVASAQWGSQLGLTGIAVRSMWFTSRCGAYAMSPTKEMLARPFLFARVLSSLGNLVAVGLRASKVRTEARKAIRAYRPVLEHFGKNPESHPRAVALAAQYQAIAARVLDEPELAMTYLRERGRSWVRFVARDEEPGTVWAKAAEELPDSLVFSSLANVIWQTSTDVSARTVLLGMAAFTARVSAEELYVPAAYIPDGPYHWERGDSEALLGAFPTQAAEAVRAEKTPGRNEPCSCGSGAKYKRCCGK
jgi:hypothetical protein